MTKSELLGIYRTSLNHIQLTYASLVLWSYPDTPDFFDSLHQEMPELPNFYPGLSGFLHDEVAMRIACEELYASAHRAALKDLFALTKLYCHETGQMPKLKGQPWFQFWRIVRNCFAHSMKFNFNPDEKAQLPVSWSGVTIDLSMNGQSLTHGQFSYEKLRELINTAYNFLANEAA